MLVLRFPFRVPALALPSVLDTFASRRPWVYHAEPWRPPSIGVAAATATVNFYGGAGYQIRPPVSEGAEAAKRLVAHVCCNLSEIGES